MTATATTEQQIRERQIEKIRSYIRDAESQIWELPRWARNFSEENQHHIDSLLTDVEIEALKWVLRTIFEVTP